MFTRCSPIKYKLSSGTESGQVISFIKALFSPQLIIFTTSLIFFASLYFSINNRTLFMLSLIYLLILYLNTKNLKHSLFLAFLATLPFAKGKTFQIIMLAREQIPRFTLFKISYAFPLYLSTFFLFLLIYVYIRKKLAGDIEAKFNQNIIASAITILAFIILNLVTAPFRIFPEVVIISGLQLIILMTIFFLPFVFNAYKNMNFNDIYAVLSASLLFQSLWVFLQKINNGPLGKDIEATLPSLSLGIGSAENPELLRLSGTFFEPSILGTFLLMHIILLSLAVLNNKLKYYSLLKKSIIVSIILGLFAMIFTGSRILYITTIVFFLVLVYNYKSIILFSLKSVNKKLILLLISICAIFIIPFLIVRISSITNAFTRYGTGTYRLQMMEYAMRLTAQQPFIGVGINHSPYFFATAFPDENFIFDPTYPHNLFFQLLAETGIIGTVLFLGFIYLALRPAIIKPKKTFNEFTAAALIFLISAQFYPIFLNHQEILSFFFLFLGFSMYTVKKS